MPAGIPKTLEELPVSSPRWVGKDVKRVEDRSLVTGSTEFIDNVTLPGMLHCAMLRSPHPHARIGRVDTREAEQLPGVAAVITGEDASRWSQPAIGAPPGWGTHCLATERVRFVGEPVAAVAAISRYIAEDALDLIRVDYEPLPAVVDPVKAMEPDSPLIFEERGGNVMFQRLFKWGEVDRVFEGAEHVFTEEFRWNRMGSNPIETFGVIGQWHPVEQAATLRGSIQSPSMLAGLVSAALGLPLSKVRVIAQPHGGAFGGKGGYRGIEASVLLSRKAGGRPVKWIEDRIDYMLASSSQAWDRRYLVSLAVERDGTVTGLRVKLLDDLGATGEGYAAVGALKPLACFTGCYAIPNAEYDLTLVATNKLPCGPYRGMGPPPHSFVLEQMMDIAARGLGMDPVEIRRKNFIPPDRFPYTIASGNEYDSGDYEATLERALEMANYPRLRDEQAEAREKERFLGIGVANAIEPGVFDYNLFSVMGWVAGTGPIEGVTLSVDLMGQILIKVGFALEGQGQYTVAAQVAADYFGVGLEDVLIVPQDTHSAPPHFGPGGSRLGVALTGAVLAAAGQLEEKLVKVAAKLLETEPEKVELMDGKLRVKGSAGVELSLAQVAATMRMRNDLLPPGVEPNPEASGVWTAPGRDAAPDEQGRIKSYLTAANACHVVLVELDPETGQVEILGYWIADDCGTRLNPANVEGMTDGGVLQGVGAALLEEYVYDEGGQPLVSTFMDYLMPTIHEAPTTEKAVLVTPSPFTPLGAKGVGEGAIHTAPAAVMCAVNDALAPLGVRVTEVPASPRRLWKLIREVDSSRSETQPRAEP